jgi:hypothetical protein
MRIAFYVVVGLALVGANAWYIRSLYRTILGRSEIVIAPIAVANPPDKENGGVALAQMLQSRLREIETDLRRAQKELMTPADKKRPDSIASQPGTDSPIATPTAHGMPRLLTEPVALKARLLESTNIEISVGGVEVGGVINWLQRQFDTPDTLVLTLYEGKGIAQISGSLSVLGLEDDAIRVRMMSSDGADAVSMNDLIEATAYEIFRRRVALDPNNRAQALDRSEFQTLVEVLRDTARLNRRVALGRGALPEFEDLLARITPLAEDVPDWYQLNYLAGNIAESAKDLESAQRFYGRVKAVVEREKDQATLLEDVQSRLTKLEASQTALIEPEKSTGPDADAARNARDRIKTYIRTATDYLNELLGHSLSPPPVQVRTKAEEGWISYWDGKKVVVPRAAEALPDIVYRESSWPHVTHVVGSEAFERNDETPTILYSYVDILPMLIQQHELKQDAKTSSWELGAGYGEIFEGKDLSQVKSRTPYLSFKKLGTARPGLTSQVGHMRNFDTSRPRGERVYVNSGIFNRAFYESAQRIGTPEAGQIWIAALRRLKSEKKVDFPRFARILHDVAAASERDRLRDALVTVGLDPTPANPSR